jgi:outer membrane protein assembly factor BamB
MKRALALSLLLAGCGEATFSAHLRDNNAEDLRRALSASRPAAGEAGHMVFLATGGPEKSLVAYDLAAGKIAWRERVDLRSRVVVGKGLIAHRQGAGELVVRDEASGRPLYTIAIADKYVGAAFDEERLYYVVQSNAGQRTSTLIAVDRAGKELWRSPALGSLGAPAARGGVVAVPYREQNLVLIDGRTGKELARVRATDEQIAFVRATPEGFFYGGGKGVTRLDEKSGNPKGETSYAEANLGSDQIRTFYWWDGYELAQTNYTAFDRNRLLWRPAQATAFQDDGVVLHSYRYFFAFDAKRGKLRWAYAHPRTDLVSADPVGASVLFVSVDGEIGAVDARTGQVRGVIKTRLPVLGATFDADGFTGTLGAPPEGANDVVATLNQIIWDRDARFTAVKLFAVEALGSLPPDTANATASLLKVVLAQSPERDVPPAVQKKAGEALVARKDPAALPLYLKALDVRFDFVEDQRPRGLDVLARACAALDAKQAAPALAAHLLDPATPQPVLKELAAALVALGSGQEALRELLLGYRADPMFLADPTALNLAAEGLLKLGGPEGRRTVAFVADEKRTLPPVSAYVKKLLSK